MYGVSSKLGRGGGRGGGGGPRNRNSFPPPPPHRAIPATGRLSLVASSTGPRHRTTTTATATARAPQAVEETFSLLPGKSPLAFAMIIRLAPDLVDEIRRLEAQGCTARIKFDSIANNTIGNVIDVGGKEFKFTWSPEFGDLCDIYEERQSGEDGNGLLVESGCAWRKVNVQRILDESTKNHVKMRSEEAERKTRSRKAIVLDPGNPDMKKQIGQLVAVESNPWRAYKPKKEPPFKKRKVDPPQVSVGGPPKSTFRPRLASTVAEKGRRSASPLPSPPEQSAAPASPVGTVNLTKSHATNEDVTPIKVKCKKNVANTEKDIPKRATSDAGETLGHKTNSVGNPVDLQSMLITLLKEHRKGMRLKDLEKAVGDVIPNSAKKIEPIIKKIATFQAPGRYFLKPGVELESFKKPSSESGSSPEDNHHQTPDPENHDRTSVPVVSFLEKIPTGELGEQAQPDSKLGDQSDILASVGVQLDSPDLFGEKKVSDNSEGQAGSSSDSGSDSDSDSDSSDSGSDSGSHSRSRSRSRSRSPVGSGSGSSSDSDSDASSNSKEGSDEDVDIITSDDDKDAKQNLQAAELGMSSSPIPCHIDDERPIQDGVDEVKDGDGSDAVDIEGHGSDAVDIEGHGSDAIDIESHGSDGVDIEKDLPDDGQEVQMAVNNTSVPNKESRKPAGGTKLFLSNHDELQERQTFIGNLFDDTENVIKDNFRHEQSDSSERKSKSKSKRGPDPKRFDEKSEQAKRLKVESLTQPPITEVKDSQFSENLQTWSPDRVVEDSYNGSSRQMINKTNRKGNANIGAQRNQTMKSGSDFQQSSHKSALAKAPDTAERSSVKYTESSEHGHKFSEKSFHLPEDFPAQKEKSSRDTPKEDSSMKEKKFSRNLKDGAGGKHSIASESYYRKHGEMVGKVKESLSFPSAHTGSSPKDDNRMSLEKYPVSGGGGFLQRELSDLELGELREPLLEETVVKKQFERKNSFRSSENKTSTSENCNLDLGKGKLVGKATFDLGKPSPSNLSVGVKRTPEHNVEDLTRSYTKVGQSQSLHYSRADNAEVGSQCNRLVDASSKSWQNGNGMKPGVSIEGYGESHRKVPNSALQQHDSKGGQVSHSIKESKTHTSNTMADLINGGKDANLFEGNNGGRKKRESSSDEDSSSYLKYEKDAPELRGPIKDLLQYKEYVQEYRDKYDSYCSLNKILESYRNEFQKLGKDLDFAKGRDMERYYKVMGQLRESYRQCGTRHKKLKRIFVVLHEELKHLKQRIKDFAGAYAKD